MTAHSSKRAENLHGLLLISCIAGRVDLTSVRRPNQELKRVNVDFPIWMVNKLDREAKRLGVTRQSIIKIWLAERLERVRTKEAS